MFMIRDDELKLLKQLKLLSNNSSSILLFTFYTNRRDATQKNKEKNPYSCIHIFYIQTYLGQQQVSISSTWKQATIFLLPTLFTGCPL